MYTFGEKHPVLFEIVIVVIGFLIAGVITAFGSFAGLQIDLCTCIGRLLAAFILYVLYHRAFQGPKPKNHLLCVLPALLFAAWNIYYNVSSGIPLGGLNFFAEGLILAAAPAVFEEVIFRGIFLYNLKRKGHGDLSAMLISAAVFAAVHLTNIVGNDYLTVLIQVGYSLVVGMVFGAVYLKNGRLSQVILAHFLTDYINHIFTSSPASAGTLHLTVFVVLLAFEAVYALWLAGRKE